MKHIAVTSGLALSVWMSATSASAQQQVPWPTTAEIQEQARNGDLSAQTWFGVLLVTGEGQHGKDVRRGVELIRNAAGSGNPLAERLLGDILSAGKLAPKDDAAALTWYQRAAKGGDADAQSELGLRHTLGWGVPKDDAEGVRWEMKAAAAGDVAALMYLAARYEKGKGVEQNPRTAVELFRQAADRGSALAMCYLADMYLWGKGVGRSEPDAYRWYFAAFTAAPAPRPIRPVDFVTLRGDSRRNCERNRKQAAKALTGDARASAEKDAREWLGKLRYTRIP